MAAIFLQYTGMFPDDPAHGAALAFTVVMLGGLFQIVMGILHWGKYIELVPHPVVSGFMSGIGVIIILLQLGPMIGHASAWFYPGRSWRHRFPADLTGGGQHHPHPTQVQP